jgi:hypothetical protein
VYNSSYYYTTASTKCSLQMYRFGFSRIIFDKTAIEALGYKFFQYGQLDSINSDTSTLTLITSPYFDNNFMMGLKLFYVNGNS